MDLNFQWDKITLTHTTRSKQLSLQNPQIRKDEPQVPNAMVVMSSCSKASIDLLITSSSSWLSIISFLKHFILVSFFFFGYRFMLKNNIIFINFIIQNRINLLLSRQHCSFSLLFLIKVYYTTTSPGYSSKDLLSKPMKAIPFLIRKSSHLCIARTLKLFVLL